MLAAADDHLERAVASPGRHEAQAGADSDASLITQLPYAAGILNQAPDTVSEALYAALDIHCTYRADKNQVTIRATITDTTPGIVAALLADPRTGDDPPNVTPAPYDEMSAADPRAGTLRRARPIGTPTSLPVSSPAC